MFNNLIESSSHTREYKRRGSFLLFTGAVYVLLFAITGVVSIYAYDAHLEQQNLEDVVLLSPQDIVTPEPAAPNRETSRPPSNADRTATVPMRIQLIDSASNPNNPPREIGTVASPIPPAPIGAIVGPENINPVGPAGRTPGATGDTGNNVVTGMPDEPPPAPPEVPQVPKTLKISTVLNSRALSLPPPIYPPIARQTGTQGTVIVQVLIDEDGKVVSAKATSGHPFLVPEAQKAAMRARFSPTILGDQKVKVQGVITYNFLLGR